METALHYNEADGFVSVCLNRPIFEAFSYASDVPLSVGVRVRVPFGHRMEVGVVVGYAPPPEGVTVKQIAEVLDDVPVVDERLLHFLRLAARYYQHPLGEVLATALPNVLMNGQANIRQLPRFFAVTDDGKVALEGRLGGKQRAVLDYLCERGLVEEERLKALFAVSSAWLSDLEKRGWLMMRERFGVSVPERRSAPTLGEEQVAAIEALSVRSGFGVDVINGVTGSGKTEVYIARIAALIEKGGQVLLLAPEIGIVELLYARLSARLDGEVAMSHSGMTDAARLAVWQAVKAGDVKVLIGTRSAVFSPFVNLRGILVDECHDQAFKQQDGFRYHGRDLAVLRAKLAGVPVVLGSATPALETWKQIQSGEWREIALTKRIRAVANARVTVDDIEHTEMVDGLSMRLITEIRRQLRDGHQVMLFLNRRGYAPVLRCEYCEWCSECLACDARMTAHISVRKMQCHHCGRVQSMPTRCPSCGSHEMALIGFGTQRIEQTVAKQFPEARLLRIDSDVFTTPKQFQSAVAQIQRGEVDIILGTQWLTKGHHFPNLQLVVVIDADAAFYSSDFRAEERLAQLLVQVGGRAGRESAGHIWVQTKQPSHPVFQVFTKPYRDTLNRLAKARALAGLPPYAAQALLFARHKDEMRVMQTLRFTMQGAKSAGIGEEWGWFGPVSAQMARKDGQHRAHILLQATDKQKLQQGLPQVMQWLLAQGKAFGVRVGIDVDPLWLD